MIRVFYRRNQNFGLDNLHTISGNETRVAEVAKVDLNEYDKAGNPISERSIKLKMIVLC